MAPQSILVIGASRALGLQYLDYLGRTVPW
jgi:hypothetical protein